MKQVALFRIGLMGILVMGFAGCAGLGSAKSKGGGSIGPAAVGVLSPGMTLEEAEAALGGEGEISAPPPNPVMVWDAEYTVRDRSGRPLMTFLPLDPFRPGAPGNVIASITARDGAYATSGGARPGMRIVDVAQIYGPATLTQEVEGTGLETIRFLNQPAYLKFVISPDAGIYPEAIAPGAAERSTGLYHPNARVTGITVGR